MKTPLLDPRTTVNQMQEMLAKNHEGDTKNLVRETSDFETLGDLLEFHGNSRSSWVYRSNYMSPLLSRAVIEKCGDMMGHKSVIFTRFLADRLKNGLRITTVDDIGMTKVKFGNNSVR